MRSVKSISGVKCSQGSPASCRIATFPRGELGFTLWRDATAHPVFRPSPNRGDPSDPRRPLVVTWRREVGLPGPQRQPGAQHGPASFHRHDLPERKALPVPQGTVAPETGNIFTFCQTAALRKHEEHEHAECLESPVFMIYSTRHNGAQRDDGIQTGLIAISTCQCGVQA